VSVIARHGHIAGLVILAAILPVIATRSAHAQRASENAVTSAIDAFGTSVGHERIGVYSPRDVRGFSPTLAGNLRIDGLYFDQVEQLNPRLEKAFAIRVGIAAQGYAFPAPTGIVDYSLRAPGDDAQLSSFVQIDTRGAGTLEFDGVRPLIDGVLSLGGGVGFNRFVDAGGFSNYETNEGVLVKWTPAPNIQLLPFWSRTDFYDAHVPENYVPDGPFLPNPNPGRHFFGPDWAHNRQFGSNYGAIAEATFSGGWDFKAGIFRSVQKKPKNFYLELDGLTQQGIGELNVYSDPPSNWGSTSGELSLARSFAAGPLTHRVTLSLRMRDFNANSGGSDIIDLGSVAIGQYIHLSQPVFQYGAQTLDHISEMTPGLSYQLSWKDVGIVGFSVQKPHYHKRSLVGGSTTPIITKDEPWLFNMAVTGFISSSITFYGDYTEGLEDNGLVPQSATNRGQALPAIATRQMDAGVSLHVIPGVSLVTGWFDIHKPYFNLSPTNLYEELGETHNKGIEFSLSGEILPRLDLVAGAVFSEPKVQGDAVTNNLVGSTPVKLPSRKVNVNLDWRPPATDNLSFGMEVSHQSHVASTLDNLVSIPEKTFVNLDTRYSFDMGKHSASLRLWVQNIFARRSWDVSSSGIYDIQGFSGRHVSLRLIVDI
jgi:iron complex outermembrane receptor protein